eukprot:442951-Amphidinium_carterae.1
MPCFLHAAYTPPALDFLGSGCVVSAVALRLSGGALAARICVCVGGPVDPDGGIGAASIAACLCFGFVGTSWTKSMGGTVDTLACCLGCCSLGCAPLTLVCTAIGVVAVLGLSTAAVGGCIAVSVATAHG